MVGRVLAYVQMPIASSRPSLGLLEAAFALLLDTDQNSGDFAGSVSAALIGGRAAEVGLLQVGNEMAPVPEQVLSIPRPLALALEGAWEPVRGTSLAQDQEVMELPPSIAELAGNYAQALAVAPRRALLLRSNSIIEARSVVVAVAAALDAVPLTIHSVDAFDEPLGILAVIGNLLPVIRREAVNLDSGRLPAFTGYDGPLVLLGEPDDEITVDDYAMMNWLVPIPGPQERYGVWSSYLSNPDLARGLARDHRQSAGRIAELAHAARREAELRHEGAETVEDIRTASWLHGGEGLASLAVPVPDRISDEALVLNANTEADLDLLLQRCRSRESLVDELGVSLRARYQPGVRALFTGPSGTGKTLAAAWLATRLAMPLYRVDLASVVSKYIGETEKNLARLLSRAERSDVILLFDEADSLFGKRTDIKDSNDRYANTQTNYLLQRIESYQGIVVLTSNSRSRFDSAFTRRIDLIIEFPSPGPDQRRSLWHSHLGSRHELSQAQINQLSATLDISGGHIRNAVLSASVLSHRDQRSIRYDDVIHGLRVEYRKLARKLPPELTR
jgi:hypothetical protein